jgi:hypothetical protein
MRGKRKLALIGTAVVLGLAILGLGISTAVVAASNDSSQQTGTMSVVTASDTTDNETSQFDTFVSKVADKLGLDEDTVATAMKEARQEMMDEALAERLQEAVDEGRITQEQADQISEWMKSRPEALDELGGFGPGCGPGFGGGGRMMPGNHQRGPF